MPPAHLLEPGAESELARWWRDHDRYHAVLASDDPPAPRERELPGVELEWTRDLEAAWRGGTRDERERWGARAEAMFSSGDRRRGAYAEARERSLSLARADVVGACTGRFRSVACGCGERSVPVGCDCTLLCGRCRGRYAARWRRRISDGLVAALADAVRAWGARGGRGLRPRVYLLTLTVPHSGDVVHDRKLLGDGWRGLYKYGQPRGWWTAYAGAHEATPGRDGKGHVHMHVALVSSWVPYRELHAAWRSATPALGDGPRVLDVRCSEGGASQAAYYVAKYVTKGADPSEMTGKLAGELLVAQRGKRRVTTSARFWQRRTTCEDCGATWRLVEHPIGMGRHAPAARLRALLAPVRSQRPGWWSTAPPARTTLHERN